MKKIDLFESLVRFLAIKPLAEESFDLEKAQSVIKEENKNDITFVGEHGYFEDLLEAFEQKIANLKPNEGSLYIYIKGEDCKRRVEKNLLRIVLNVHHIYIIGEAQDWKINETDISFLPIEDIFADNHQRFMVFRSPSYNIALTSRHSESAGSEKKIEAALTNKKEAVSFIGQILGKSIYQAGVE